jgi:hypothetical protein
MALLHELEAHESELKSHIDELRRKFIDKYIPAQPNHSPDIFGHEVQAFCLLAHAAFEHFIEKISQYAGNLAVKTFIAENKVSYPLLTLCLFYQAPIEHSEEKISQESIYILVKKAAETAKKAHGVALFSNHGFSLGYLRRSLTPIGINIPKDARFESSLGTLTDARGTFAHTLSKGSNYFENKGRAKFPKILTPENARDSANDCQELCMLISQQLKGLFPRKSRLLVEREARILRWKNSGSIQAKMSKRLRTGKKHINTILQTTETPWN